MSVFSPDVVITNTPLPIDTTGQTINVGNFPGSQPVTGPLTDTELRATPVPVSGPLTDAQLRATPVPISGTVSIGSTTTSATVTNVPVGPSVVTISASNVAKTKVIVYNETGTLYVKFGTGASSASYSMRLTANTSFEFSGYAGIVTAIKASGTTAVHVTEIGI